MYLVSGLAIAGLTVALLKGFPELDVGLAIADAAGFVGSLVLFFESFTKRGRMLPHWQRVVGWMIGPIAVAWSWLDLTLLLASKLQISADTHHALNHLRSVFFGMGLGILLLLGISRATQRFTSDKSAG